jgi:hypothetical protein
MNYIITLLGLILFHFITGHGIIHLFKIKIKTWPHIALSVMLGVLVASLVPFLMQLFYIAITPSSVFLTWGLIAAGLNVKTLLDMRKGFSFRPASLLPSIKLYELPAILLIAFMLFVSAWRCFYYPSYVRDGLSGPEAIADFAIKEHTLINSIFSINLETTNNQYKSLFLTDLQIIYKYAGFPFGNVWVSVLAISFYIFLYGSLSERIHRVLAGLFLVFFIFTPEAYGYTFMGLFDYSNMIFFFLGFYFLVSYLQSRNLNEFYFSALLMTFSIYIRSETLVLVAMAAPLMLYSAFRAKEKMGNTILHIAIFMLICALAYIIPVQVYNNHYLPQAYAVDSLMNKNLGDLDPFFQRISDMTSELIFGERGTMLWGYFMYIFVILFIAELVIKRKFNKDARNWLIAVLIIYIGLPLLGYLFPLVDLNNTTKRGLFKILPLMLFYMANNQLVLKLSEKIGKWENG